MYFGDRQLLCVPAETNASTLVPDRVEVRKWWNGEDFWWGRDGRGLGGGKGEIRNQIPSRQQVLHNPEWVITSSFFLLVSFSPVPFILQTPLE